MPTYLTPGVYFESVDEASLGVASIRTDVAAFVGIAAQGPVHRATPVESWVQFQSAFGDFLPNAYLAYAAKAFFENGGEKLYIVRIAAPQATTKTNSAALQPADGSASIVLASEGFARGAVVTARQTADAIAVGAQPADRLSSLVDTVSGFPAGSLVQITQPVPFFQAWHKVRAVDPGTKRLCWTSPLEPQFLLAPPLTFSSAHQRDVVISAVSGNALTWLNGLGEEFNTTQSIEFNTGVASASGVFNDAPGVGTLSIEASSPGSWGDSLAVSVSHSSVAATRTSSAAQPAAGDRSFVQGVVGFPKTSVVRIFQTQAGIQVVGFRKLAAVNPATNLLQWDTPLIPQFDVTKPISFETLEFALTVELNGSPKETFTGLSLDPLHPRYISHVVNPQTDSELPQVGMPSQYIRAKDLKSTTPYPNNLPDPAAPQLDDGVLHLMGGRDGIAALKISDFIGDPGSEAKWGIRTLEDVDEVSIVAAPDILIEPSPAVVYTAPPQRPANPCLPCSLIPPTAGRPAPPPVEATPQFSLEEIFQVQQGLIAHCALMQFRFAILDPPDFGYPEEHIDLGEIQSWRQRFDTMYAALYYPWVLVLDPLRSTSQIVRRIPPSGHVAGVYANTDLTVGVHKAPANSTVQWAQDLTNQMTPEMQAFLNPISVNCLRSFSGRGMRVYGARTLSSIPSWRFVNVRRLMSMIEHALELSMQWVVFEPNNIHLWNLMRVSIGSFLQSVWNKGALVGNTAADAYYVKSDGTTNPLAVIAAGELVVEIGVAPARPAEFVVFRLGKQQDGLEVTEA